MTTLDPPSKASSTDINHKTYPLLPSYSRHKWTVEGNPGRDGSLFMSESGTHEDKFSPRRRYSVVA